MKHVYICVVHVDGIELNHKEGRHSEAPEVVGDEVIQMVKWDSTREEEE